MLKAENRLSTTFEFNVARKYGNYFNFPLFHAYTLIAKNYTGPARIGIVISNKFHKNAVVRNRVKRLFRESLQKKVDTIKSGLWIVFHPKLSATNQTYEKIDLEITRFLQKASVIK